MPAGRERISPRVHAPKSFVAHERPCGSVVQRMQWGNAQIETIAVVLHGEYDGAHACNGLARVLITTMFEFHPASANRGCARVTERPDAHPGA